MNESDQNKAADSDSSLGEGSFDEEGFAHVEASFGRGSSDRKLLVSRPTTLKQIHLTAKED